MTTNSFEYGEGLSRKKHDIEEAKAQKKMVKEKEKDRKKQAGDTNAVRKYIIQFD